MIMLRNRLPEIEIPGVYVRAPAGRPQVCFVRVRRLVDVRVEADSVSAHVVPHGKAFLRVRVHLVRLPAHREEVHLGPVLVERAPVVCGNRRLDGGLKLREVLERPVLGAFRKVNVAPRALVCVVDAGNVYGGGVGLLQKERVRLERLLPLAHFLVFEREPDVHLRDAHAPGEVVDERLEI